MNKIPKVIHYCWFGGNKKSKLIKKCIRTWKKYLPDYEIIEWNEKNFDINICNFTKEAYENKKWAFVSDYCRIWVLYNYGGIYLDTDMEVLKSLDSFLEQNSFGGMEKIGNKYHINFAIWGCKKNDEFIGEVLKYYSKLDFLKYKNNLLDIAIPNIVTDIADKKGFDKNNLPNKFFNDTTIYPYTYFYPKGHEWEEANITDNTHTIHHYDGSWKKSHEILRSKFKVFLIKIFGHKIVNKSTNIIKKI